MLIFSTSNFEVVRHGAKLTSNLDWATGHAKFGWLVVGIFAKDVEGASHINDVEFSPDQSLIATGDNYGLVNLWRNPARYGHRCISLRGHSEQVTRVRFMCKGKYLISAGGHDKSIMQWRRVMS